MHFRNTLFLAATVAVSAQDDADTTVYDIISDQGQVELSPQCSKAAEALVLPSDLLDFPESLDDVWDGGANEAKFSSSCVVPPDATSAFSSFTSAYVSFLGASSDEIVGVVTDCDLASSIHLYRIDSVFPAKCTNLVDAIQPLLAAITEDATSGSSSDATDAASGPKNTGGATATMTGGDGASGSASVTAMSSSTVTSSAASASSTSDSSAAVTHRFSFVQAWAVLGFTGLAAAVML